MIKKRFFLPDGEAGGLDGWLSKMAEGMRVMTPVREGISVVFRDYEPGAALECGDNAAAGPKSVVFPQTEYLMRFKAESTAPVGGHRRIEIEPVYPDEDVLIFGANPCGARGLELIDEVFLHGSACDPYYKARRDRTLVASLACASAGNACFCNHVGGAPDDPRGSDLMFKKIHGGYLVEAITDKGVRGIGDSLEPAGEEQIRDAEEKMAEVKAGLGEPSDLTASRDKLREVFGDIEFWQEMAGGCIHCGACTYYCPTCYCFNITDEASGLAGERIRTWDSCMFPGYTREASGHNPRATRAHRLRNRVMHKFSYYPALYDDFSCTGCGRCIRLCPMGVNILEIVQKALERNTEAASA